RAPKVALYVDVARANKAQRRVTAQVLRAGRDVDATVGIRVVGIGQVIGVGVVDHRVRHVQRHAAHAVDDADEALQADPDPVIDGDAKVALDGAGCGGKAQHRGRVDLAPAHCAVGAHVIAVARDVDPEIAGNG